MIIFAVNRAFHRSISCLPTTFLRVSYSASAQPKRKRALPPPLKEPPFISVSEKYRGQPIVIDPKILIGPDIYATDLLDKRIVDSAAIDVNISEKSVNTPTKWKLGSIEIDPTKLHKYCLMLSKIRLTSLVVITAMGGYAIAPAPFELYSFLALSVGTGLVSASANAINQSLEIPFDAQMARTKNRVLVRGLLTPTHALIFAAASGIAGVSLLAYEVNTLTALLGGANLLLYTLIYTPLKRISIVNTWVGSIVGAIPPLMGWAGCTGSIAAPGAWIMSGILYAWQFPHFNALSWNLKPDYSKAGYKMMVISNPDLCRRTALRYTAALTALSYLAPALDVTNWWFAVASTPLNIYFLYLAWEFNKQGNASTSRKLFRFSLLHLPVLMVLMLISKKYWFINDKKSITPSSETQETKRLTDIIMGILPSSA